MNNNRLAEYADLIVKTGVNIQKGQLTIISCPIECADFARLLAEKAYDTGAGEVIVNWLDDRIDRLKYIRGADEIFDNFPEWRKSYFQYQAYKKAAKISVYAEDPEKLVGVDPDRIKRWSVSSGNALKFYSDSQMANEFVWCVVSMPTAAWAKKVFPSLDSEKAVDALWDEIYKAVRVNGDGKSVEKWQEHINLMNSRRNRLNDWDFSRLIYKNSLGTNLTVELPLNHSWTAAEEIAKTGVKFIANMPTEEIFTLPKKDGINGTVYASKPLALDGNLIENFSFKIKDGKIIECFAEKGLEHLKNAVSVDEGASFFGEVALVPFDSPINNSRVLFYNTLFDENASCHFAFGGAYPCFKDADSISAEEMATRGMNDSITHEDFMIGTADLSVIGVTKDGKSIPVFTNGNFAF